MTYYNYAICNCDVDDKERVREFRWKRYEWLHWLSAEENQPIADQINAMMWSDAVFRLINETRKSAIESDGAFAVLNGTIAAALDRGYVAEQLIAFRKLLEPASNKPERQVISLKRLLADVKKNRELITREVFVCYNGLPFDHNEGRISADVLPKEGCLLGVSMSGPKAYPASFRRHQCFNLYFSKGQHNGERGEVLPDDFFEGLETEIAEAPFDQAKRYANKILLHAADGHSLGSEPIDGLTLGNMWSCQRALLRVANQLSVLIGGHNLSAVPVPQYNVIEHLAKPFAPAVDLKKVRRSWEFDNDARNDWML